MAMKVPDRPTPALQGRGGGVEREGSGGEWRGVEGRGGEGRGGERRVAHRWVLHIRIQPARVTR